MMYNLQIKIMNKAIPFLLVFKDYLFQNTAVTHFQEFVRKYENESDSRLESLCKFLHFLLIQVPGRTWRNQRIYLK